MPTPIDPKRLPTLRAALKRFKEGDKVPQQDLAKIYGVTNARLTTLIKNRFASFPEAERHGDKTHWYPAIPALQSMIAYLTAGTTRKQDSASRVAQVMTGAKQEAAAADPEPAEPEKRVMTPQDLDKLASASTKIFRLQAEKRMFVRADAARSLIRTMFTSVQRSITALPTEIDPNGELPPLQRVRLEEACRAALIRIHGGIAEILDADAV
jgi:hypothetical protein